ncbi:hypothetical protein BKA82DRAFT_4017488 [Pisolithus tinctorius]|nr:hypothetical protein BKA82DRAFT_4017488 [Pisolithus tinctorius]
MWGKEAIDQLRLVTTASDEDEPAYHTQTRCELMHRFRGVLGGARCEKFDNTPESAWAIVEGLGDEKKVFSIQKKMVDDEGVTSGLKWIADLLSWNKLTPL